MPKKRRTYRQVHDSYLIEYLGMTYPPGSWMTNVPLGELREELITNVRTQSEMKALRPFLASADAIVFLKDEVHIIECMIRHEPGAIEDLLKYKKLFGMTSDFKKWWSKPLKLILLTPLDDEFYEEFAREHGIEVRKYKPIWIIEYLNTYPRRFRRGQLSAVKY